MALSLDMLLAAARSDQIKCAAGFKGLSRPVLDTSIIDTPEILLWLKGGELVMSTGYVLFNNREMMHTIVRDLANKGCAGLAFKSKRYFDEIPQVILDQGNELDFPILELSYDMRISDLANFVYSNIYKSNMTAQEQKYNLYNNITTALALNRDINYALFEISKNVQNPVFLLNNKLELQAYEFPENITEDITGFLKLERGDPPLTGMVLNNVLCHYQTSKFREYTVTLESDSREINFLLFSLVLNGEDLGFLGVLDIHENTNIEHFRLIEGITTLLCIHILKNTLSHSPGIGDKNSFIKNILLEPQQSEETVKKYSNIFGFQYKLKRVFVVVQIIDFLSLAYNRKNIILSSIAEKINQTLTAQEQSFFYSQYEDKFIYSFFFNLSVEDEKAVAIVMELCKKIKMALQGNLEDKISFYIGVSDCSIGWKTISQTYTRALNAISLGKKLFQNKRIYSYTENLSYHILDECLSHGQLITLYTNTVAALDVYDKENDATLMRTMEVFCKQNYNRIKTADALYIHRNTLTYRLNKIEEVLHISLVNYETLHNLFLGIIAKKLLDNTL